ncbi:MAG: DUF3524 domain-containing protein [Phycisphaerae bacterium]|nr:DUF3524 domain-containing protein [Phycisphaerae bacterium]
MDQSCQRSSPGIAQALGIPYDTAMTKQTKCLNILALEPYYDGSHKAFLDGWMAHSNHHWTLMTLPGYKWKWRMRHGAITLARQLRAISDMPPWDLIVCSDMLNLAEFRGLIPRALAGLPTVVYFHENQLTYPMRFAQERDYHYAMTNLTTAMAADQVWFNSRFHRDSCLKAARDFLVRMPDYAPLDALLEIRDKSQIHYPGILPIPNRPDRTPGPCRILWAARWEHDKNPDDFFEAVRQVRQLGLDFRLSVIGQRFQDQPRSFKIAHTEFSDLIDDWGFQTTRQDYWQCLQHADIAVSTAHHEFFGIGMIEAMCAGAYPLLPERLSYPEILNLDRMPAHQCFFYDGAVPSLVRRLTELIQKGLSRSLWQDTPSIESLVHTYHWTHRAAAMDQALASHFFTQHWIHDHSRDNPGNQTAGQIRDEAEPGSGESPDVDGVHA